MPKPSNHLKAIITITLVFAVCFFATFKNCAQGEEFDPAWLDKNVEPVNVLLKNSKAESLTSVEDISDCHIRFYLVTQKTIWEIRQRDTKTIMSQNMSSFFMSPDYGWLSINNKKKTYTKNHPEDPLHKSLFSSLLTEAKNAYLSTNYAMAEKRLIAQAKRDGVLIIVTECRPEETAHTNIDGLAPGGHFVKRQFFNEKNKVLLRTENWYVEKRKYNLSDIKKAILSTNLSRADFAADGEHLGKCLGVKTYSYAPMDDKIFTAPVVPEGYTEVPDRPDSLPHCRFSGVVVDPQGKPVPHARICPDHTRLFVCDDEGKFNFIMSDTLNTFFLKAWDPDNKDICGWTIVNALEFQRKFPDLIPDSGGKIFVEPNKKDFRGPHKLISATNLILKLEQSMSIRGIVTDPSGAPLENAVVVAKAVFINEYFQIYDYKEALPYASEQDVIYGGPTIRMFYGDMPGWSAKTDENGHYEIPSVPRVNENFKVKLFCFSADNYLAEVRDCSQKDGVINEDFALVPWGATVRGRVINEKGKPVANYPVRAMAAGRFCGNIVDMTDLYGNFCLYHFPNTKDAAVALAESLDFYDRVTSSGKELPKQYYGSVSKPVKIEDGKDEYFIELKVKEPKVELTIKVKDEEGKPVEECLVSMQGEKPLRNTSKPIEALSLRTDRNGICVFENFSYMRIFEEARIVARPDDSRILADRYFNMDQKILRRNRQLRDGSSIILMDKDKGSSFYPIDLKSKDPKPVHPKNDDPDVF